MNTTLILAIAGVIILLIVVLLFKKIVKAFVGLLLIAAIAGGAYWGISALDARTSLRKNIPAVETAFAALQKHNPNIRFIQANLVSADVGITVIYSLKEDKNSGTEQALLEETKNILFDSWQAVMGRFSPAKLPVIRITFQFNRLAVSEYEAVPLPGSLATGEPEACYPPFIRVVNTGGTPSPTP